MKDRVEKPLVVSSIAGLWSTHMADSAAICMFKHFLKHVDMKETKDIKNYLYRKRHFFRWLVRRTKAFDGKRSYKYLFRRYKYHDK